MIAVLNAMVLAASDWSYVAGAYIIVVGVLATYSAAVIIRGRKVGKQLPAKDRRWSSE
ncbi:MAG: hypothetical protein KDA95_00190 [Acidimicrobiales bacterium]|nr:hypothetical protein [Acidimicrobiales bacterium]